MYLVLFGPGDESAEAEVDSTGETGESADEMSDCHERK
jgi:hypothetical protein